MDYSNTKANSQPILMTMILSDHSESTSHLTDNEYRHVERKRRRRRKRRTRSVSINRVAL